MPFRGPDLNPIKHVSMKLGRRIGRNYCEIHIVGKFDEALLHEWIQTVQDESFYTSLTRKNFILVNVSFKHI